MPGPPRLAFGSGVEAAFFGGGGVAFATTGLGFGASLWAWVPHAPPRGFAGNRVVRLPRAARLAPFAFGVTFLGLAFFRFALVRGSDIAGMRGLVFRRRGRCVGLHGRRGTGRYRAGNGVGAGRASGWRDCGVDIADSATGLLPPGFRQPSGSGRGGRRGHGHRRGGRHDRRRAGSRRRMHRRRRVLRAVRHEQRNQSADRKQSGKTADHQRLAVCPGVRFRTPPPMVRHA